MIMLRKKQKEKNNLDCIISISITLLLAFFGIFISHYNSDKFIEGDSAPYYTATSKELTNKVEAAPYSKATSIIFDVNIDELNSSFDTVYTTKFQTDTSTSCLFQIVNFNFSNFIFTNPNTYSTPTN